MLERFMYLPVGAWYDESWIFSNVLFSNTLRAFCVQQIEPVTDQY